ncbi:MAG: choice-of-anchor D domain-containing protein, partial [Candidatus Latescibacterota bacterium]
GETGSQIIELANIGNADLTIDQIRSTSAEFTIYTQMDPANRLVLPANSLRTLPIHVAFSPSSRGTLSGALRIDGFWEEGTETLDVLLNGTGVAAEIEINPTGVVDFGYVVLGETEERTLVATNSGDTILQVEAHPETPEVRVDPATFSLGPGESTRLKVSFTPGALGERLGRVLLVSNDVKDKARPLTFKGQGALKNIDLSSITRVIATRKEEGLPLPINWNNTPIVQKDETKIDVVFDLPDSLREALVGREFIVEWTTLDENYDPKGASQQTSVKIYESSEGRVLAEDINLRMLEKSNRRVRLKVTTRSYPGAPPQSISQILQAGGWKWEFEAKPLVSFLTIRPGRNYEDADGNRVKGKTERLIGLPGIAFAGWHNVDNPSIS